MTLRKFVDSVLNTSGFKVEYCSGGSNLLVIGGRFLNRVKPIVMRESNFETNCG